METNEFINCIEEYIKNLDLSVADLEALGASLNALGYLVIYYGARTETCDLLTNNEVDITPAKLLLLGQVIIVVGYLILWLASTKRFYSIKLQVDYLERLRWLSSYKKLERSYIISSFANFLRLEAFYEIFIERNLNVNKDE